MQVSGRAQLGLKESWERVFSCKLRPKTAFPHVCASMRPLTWRFQTKNSLNFSCNLSDSHREGQKLLGGQRISSDLPLLLASFQFLLRQHQFLDWSSFILSSSSLCSAILWTHPESLRDEGGVGGGRGGGGARCSSDSSIHRAPGRRGAARCSTCLLD